MKNRTMLVLLFSAIFCAPVLGQLSDTTEPAYYKIITAADADIPGNIAHALIYVPFDDADFHTLSAREASLHVTVDGETTVLPRYINAWTDDGDSVVGGLYFTSPLTDGQDNKFRIWYDANADNDGSQDGAGICSAIGAEVFIPCNEGTGGTVADISGNGHNGTLEGDATWNASGKLGPCLQLDGTDDYVDCGSFDSHSWSAYTLWSWVNYDSSGTDEHSVISNFDNSNTHGSFIMRLEPSNDTIESYAIIVSDTQVGAQFATAITANQWQSVGVTFDSSLGMHAYPDGTKSATSVSIGAALDADYSSSDNHLLLGSSPHAVTDDLTGYLGCSIVFTRCLDDIEMLWLANNQDSATGLFSWGSETAADWGAGPATPALPPPIIWFSETLQDYNDLSAWYDGELAPRVHAQIQAENRQMIDSFLSALQLSLCRNEINMSVTDRQWAWMRANKLKNHGLSD